MPVKVFQSAPEIFVDGPRSTASGNPNMLAPTTTALFRHDALLPVVLSKLYELNPLSSFRFVSAGCSVGAEADSVLALHSLAMPDREVTLLGIDGNAAAIIAARRAYHRVSKEDYPKHKMKRNEAKLAKLGIKRALDDVSAEYRQLAQIETLTTREAREGHNVTFLNSNFVVHDLEGVGADLVLANNVIYHSRPDLATAGIHNLAKALASGGILSLGRRYRKRKGQRRMSMSPVRYDEWLERTISEAPKIGLDYITEDPIREPDMFVKR